MESNTIHTERLILRVVQPDDFDDLFLLHSDANVMQMVGSGEIMDLEEAFRYHAFMIGHWQILKSGSWVVEDKETGKIIGRTGFSYRKAWDCYEMTNLYNKDYWGKGFASEAARAGLKWGWENIQKDEFVCVIHAENHKSLKQVKNLGMSHVMDTTDEKGKNLTVFSIKRGQ